MFTISYYVLCLNIVDILSTMCLFRCLLLLIVLWHFLGQASKLEPRFRNTPRRWCPRPTTAQLGCPPGGCARGIPTVGKWIWLMVSIENYYLIC